MERSPIQISSYHTVVAFIIIIAIYFEIVSFLPCWARVGCSPRVNNQGGICRRDREIVPQWLGTISFSPIFPQFVYLSTHCFLPQIPPCKQPNFGDAFKSSLTNQSSSDSCLSMNVRASFHLSIFSIFVITINSSLFLSLRWQQNRRWCHENISIGYRLVTFIQN